jgi:hypothetical protein
MIHRSRFASLALVLVSISASACTTREERWEVVQDPNCAGDGADAGSKSPATGSGSVSTLGPECETYLECCDEIADANPTMAASCDNLREQLEAAQAKRASTSSYESACKSGLSSAQSAGFCE